ncbi:MAG: YebC/PmpR family DNA-binding transcriptional regulator [Gammaproteobacteria bacterium]
MAGHSKWANIQHRKNAQDAKRGKLFTKLIREITTAARMGGGDENSNPRLRLAMDKAFTANMSKDIIMRAIKRGAGGEDDAHMEEITYEGYGPGGVAVYIECLTDNRNRTVGEVRHALTKSGGNLGTDGSVAYLFQKTGQLIFANTYKEDDIVEAALESGAQDVQTMDDGTYEVKTAPEDFSQIKSFMESKHLKPEVAEITYLPSLHASVDIETGKTILGLIDKLEDLDDVQNVYTNADIPDESYH